MEQEGKTQLEKKIVIIRISRLPETILGVLGGIFGIMPSISIMFMGGLTGFVGINDLTNIADRGFIALVLSVFGLVGGAIASRKSNLAGILMIACGVGGLITIQLGYILAGALLVIGGFLSMMKE